MRGGQRTFFAVLCVAVGVASLVALQSLAASIRDTLTSDIQARAGGDIVAKGSSFTSSTDSNTGSNTVTPQAQQYLDGLKANGRIVDWTSISFNNIQIRGYFSLPPSLYTVDPARFPLYGKIEMVEPSGGDFHRLLAEPNGIIVSRYLWDKNNYKLGQEIEVTGSANNQNSVNKAGRLKIVGMVKSDVPGVPFDSGTIFGFGLISPPTAATFLEAETSSTQALSYYFKTPPGANNDALRREISSAAQPAGTEYRYLPNLFYNVQTAAEIQEQISTQLNNVDYLLSIVGLLAILIGGVGVINTMLVVIGRRTTEIATVKALGLKNRQTILIFTLEAVILGLLGSLLGLVLGVALGFGVKGVAEGLFFRPLNWGLYPGPLIIGFLVGTITSGVFGFLPSYGAGRVRPATVLRQQTTALPRIGGWTTVLIICLMTLVMGLIAGVLINALTLGIVIAFVTLLVLLLLTAFMYLAVFLTGKLPAPFGPSFKMAMRSFSRHRGRTATTLLVMTTGLFFITFIVIIADSIKTSLRQTFDVNLGFNVVALNLLGNQTEQLLTSFQKDVPGLQKIFAGNSISANIQAVNGQTPNAANAPTTRGPGGSTVGLGGNSSISLSGRALANGESISPNGPQTLVAGRNLSSADANKQVLLVSEDEARRLGVKVGDRVTIQLYGNSFGPAQPGVQRSAARTEDFEVVGIVRQGTSSIQFERGWVAPFKVVADAGINFSIFYMLVDRAQIKPALTQVQTQLVGGYVFDLGDLIDTFSRILDQVLAFPLLLSLLSLFSGAILIANNVALAMLERRTEIGVLKAIGAKRRRVLNILLWESSLVGLLGGLIGVGFGVVLALLVPTLASVGGRGSSSANSIPITFSLISVGLLLALGIGLAVFATVVSAWGAIQEKPLVVLRYE